MLKKLLAGWFGGGDETSSEAEPVEYNGYLIVADPQDVGGQYRVSGWIRKPVEGGEMLEHRFERSDVVAGRDACEELMISKAQRFIDDLGDDMFDSSSS
ncbi:HlyU family transcriptional regulator [Aidingimonas lacisalsi]|uniref:HlyU family transcriptional regulator n=1 Tax=Aidingimonas lacisalsi TaxID=2604086 RepID=UPI0011D2127A|nr:HlyU family transcriptional regulator [Aidingimonas lacisalsi]